MHHADRPTIAAPGARPGSAQTVLTASAAKVLLSTRNRHLHAGWPGLVRGLRGGGGGGSPEARGRTNGDVVARALRRAGRLRRLQRESAGRTGPAGAGCWRSWGLQWEERNTGDHEGLFVYRDTGAGRRRGK